MGKTILVADDSKTIREAVSLTFRASEFRVVSASDGNDALLRVAEAAPDLVIADVAMPGKNGYELCNHLKQDSATSSIPVLLLAGAFEPFDERRAEEVHADGHILKPFETQALIDRVKTLTRVAIGSDVPMSFAASMAAKSAEGPAPTPDPPTARIPSQAPTQPAAQVQTPAAIQAHAPIQPQAAIFTPAPASGRASGPPSTPPPLRPSQQPPSQTPLQSSSQSSLQTPLQPPLQASSASQAALPRSASKPPTSMIEDLGMLSGAGAQSGGAQSPFGPPRTGLPPLLDATALKRDAAAMKARTEDAPGLGGDTQTFGGFVIEEPDEVIEDADELSDEPLPARELTNRDLPSRDTPSRGLPDARPISLESTIPVLEPPRPPSEAARARLTKVDMWALAEASDASSSQAHLPDDEGTVPGALRTASVDLDFVEEISVEDHAPARVTPARESSSAMIAGRIAVQAPRAIAESVAPILPGLSKEELVQLAKETIERIAWEIVPDLADLIIRAEIKRLIQEQQPAPRGAEPARG